jgi:hypothetical protein
LICGIKRGTWNEGVEKTVLRGIFVPSDRRMERAV